MSQKKKKKILVTSGDHEREHSHVDRIWTNDKRFDFEGLNG